MSPPVWNITPGPRMGDRTPVWNITRGPRMGEDIVAWATEQVTDAVTECVQEGMLVIAADAHDGGHGIAEPPYLLFLIKDAAVSDPYRAVPLADALEYEISGYLDSAYESVAEAAADGAAFDAADVPAHTRLREVLRTYADLLDRFLANPPRAPQPPMPGRRDLKLAARLRAQGHVEAAEYIEAGEHLKNESPGESR